MRIFNEALLSDYLARRLDSLKNEVNSESKNRLLNVNEVEYRDYLVRKYDIVPLNFQWDLMSVSDSERLIPAERYPSNFYVERGKSYPRQVITFHVPFVGESELLRLQPSARLLWSEDVEVRGNAINLDFVSFHENGEDIKRSFETLKSKINQQLQNVLNEVVVFNRSLPLRAEEALQSRKKQLLQMSNLLESLGVPVQRSNSVPSSFTVPVTKARPIIKPATSDEPYAPEPKLGEEVYQQILQVCRQVGVEIERHPSIYSDKSEETLRDHFLMVLSPHFQSVTGETFNKCGKTDILIRHDSSNVFVAECKFWKGKKSMNAAIKQVLSYLTWRDSKAALIFFVKNSDIEGVIETGINTAMESEYFVRNNGRKADGWLDFDFRLAKDNPKGLRLSILFFHFPALLNSVD